MVTELLNHFIRIFVMIEGFGEFFVIVSHKIRFIR